MGKRKRPAQWASMSKATGNAGAGTRPPIDAYSPASKAARQAVRRLEQRQYRATSKGKAVTQSGNVRMGGGARAYVRRPGNGPRARYSAAQLAKRSAASKAFKAGRAAADYTAYIAGARP